MPAKYVKIADDLKTLILNSLYRNYKLPTEAELCKKYNVSRQTIRTALSLLEREEIIVKRQGSGSFVSRTLSSKSKSTVALILPYDNEYVYPQLISEIRKGLSYQNYDLEVYSTCNDNLKERNILNSLLEKKITAIISEGLLSVLPSGNSDLYDRLYNRGIPILFINCSYQNMTSYPYVKVNYYKEGYLAADYLISLGHKNIFCIFKLDDERGIQRYHGFAEAMRDRSVPFSQENILWLDEKAFHHIINNPDKTVLREYIKNTLPKVSSVVCHNNELEYMIIKYLKSFGVDVPRDVSVIGFDNSYLMKLGSTKATTIDATQGELTDQIVKTIVRLIGGRSVSSITLEPHLFNKMSTGKLN